MNLKQKVKLTDSINTYIQQFSRYNLKGKAIGKAGRVYIQDSSNLDRILKKLFRVSLIRKNGTILAKYKGLDSKWARIQIPTTGRIVAEYPRKSCCYENRQCRHSHRLCNGDSYSWSWNRNIANVISVEDFLVSTIGFVNSFHPKTKM